jgi:hypothetical protein
MIFNELNARRAWSPEHARKTFFVVRLHPREHLPVGVVINTVEREFHLASNVPGFSAGRFDPHQVFRWHDWRGQRRIAIGRQQVAWSHS